MNVIPICDDAIYLVESGVSHANAVESIPFLSLPPTREIMKPIKAMVWPTFNILQKPRFSIACPPSCHVVVSYSAVANVHAQMLVRIRRGATLPERAIIVKNS